MVSCLLACVYVDEIGLQCFSFNWLSLRRRFCGGKAGTQEQFCVSLCISIKKKRWEQQCGLVLAGSSPIRCLTRDAGEGSTAMLIGAHGAASPYPSQLVHRHADPGWAPAACATFPPWKFPFPLIHRGKKGLEGKVSILCWLQVRKADDQMVCIYIYGSILAYKCLYWHIYNLPYIYIYSMPIEYTDCFQERSTFLKVKNHSCINNIRMMKSPP